MTEEQPPTMSVKERAKLFENISVNSSNNSSLIDIGNSSSSRKSSVSDLLKNGEEYVVSNQALKTASVTTKPPPVAPKPHLLIKVDQGHISSSGSSSMRSAHLSDGSENISTTPSTSDNSERTSSAPSEEHLPDFNHKILNVVEELVSTEVTYLAVLDLLIVEFPAAMSNLNNGEPSMDAITGVLRIEDLKPIKTFHCDHLLPQFRTRLDSWQSNPCISDIILKSVKFFKMYSSFVVNQDTVIKEFDRQLAHFPDYKRAVDAFLSDITSNPVYAALKSRLAFRFTEFFRAPFNRLFHYKNILERYSKELEKQAAFTGIPSMDLEGAQKAIAEMDLVIKHLNTKMNEHANVIKFEEQLRNLRMKIPDVDKFFVEKELKLIREGHLMKRSRKADQLRYVVLFDTHIVVAKQAQWGSTFAINHTFDLRSLHGASVEERDHRNFILNVPMPHSSCVFRTANPKECDQWVQDIEDCRRRLAPEENNTTLCLPPWKPDHMFTNCTQCSKKFSTTVRKHHCRTCGLVYCEACSRQRQPIQGTLMRVCDICSAIINIDLCPSAELPSSVLDKFGGTRELWDTKTHSEKWYLYKDEFFIDPNTGSVPYLREIIAASTSANRAGYLYLWDPKNAKFLSRWVVLEQDCLVLFEACHNTVALERRFLAGFKFEGPFPVANYEEIRKALENKQSSEHESIRYVFACFHENYNNLSESLILSSSTVNSNASANLKVPPRRSLSSTFSKMLGPNSSSSSNAGGVIPLYYIFGVDEDFIAEDWIKELQLIKRHSELLSSSSNTSTSS